MDVGNGLREMVDTLRGGCALLLYTGCLLQLMPSKTYEPYIKWLVNSMLLVVLLRIVLGFCSI